jgi:DNA gyrase subunit A
MFATRHGMVKKTAIQAYDRSRRDGIIAINLRDDDELISVRRVKTGERVMMVSTSGKAIKWSEAEARPMGRDTMGVRGMNIKSGDSMLGMEIAPDDAELFVVTERGYGKRTLVGEYPEHHRGGQGVKTIQVTPKKGPLTGMKIVLPQHELMLVSEEGVVIRVKADDISKLGRSTQGVKVMNVAETDRVSAIARVSTGKKKPKARGVGEGQGLLPMSEAESETEASAAEVIEDETEELMAEEFEDSDGAEETDGDE